MSKKVAFLFILFAFVLLLQPVVAQEAAAKPAAGGNSVNMWIAIVAASALAIASATCGIAQSNAIRSAADGISRNPGSADAIRGMLIIGLAFIESLVIYVLLIAFMLYFKWA